MSNFGNLWEFVGVELCVVDNQQVIHFISTKITNKSTIT